MRTLMLAFGVGALAAGSAVADYLVEEIGSFHVGGEEVELAGLPKQMVSFTEGMAPIEVDPNGRFEVGQMYVQYVRLAEPEGLPVLFWHGGGLTGVTWETKPDGDPGWQEFFLEAGHDTYVSDAVERGRASWARYPEIYDGPPIFRTKAEGWSLFRIGPPEGWSGDPAERETLPGSKFPAAAYDQFTKQSVPRWVSNDERTQAAYDALVERVCPCVIVVHSQGGNFGYRAALNNPDLVEALVAVEPSGAPDPATADPAKVAGVPHLVVFGDYLEMGPWPPLVEANRAWQQAVEDAGGTMDWLDLPAEGITGNSHMLMMDTNSDEIAARILGWVEANTE